MMSVPAIQVCNTRSRSHNLRLLSHFLDSSNPTTTRDWQTLITSHPHEHLSWLQYARPSRIRRLFCEDWQAENRTKGDSYANMKRLTTNSTPLYRCRLVSRSGGAERSAAQDLADSGSDNSKTLSAVPPPNPQNSAVDLNFIQITPTPRRAPT